MCGAFERKENDFWELKNIIIVIKVWKDSAVSCMIQIIENNEGDLIAESLSLPKL